VPTWIQQTPVQRLSPENKEVSPYIPLQAGYRSRKQSSTHIWLHVTLLAISFPQCYVTFMFQFFKFSLSALPSLPLPRHQSTGCLFLLWSPPCCSGTSGCCAMALQPTHKHKNLGSHQALHARQHACFGLLCPAFLITACLPLMEWRACRGRKQEATLLS
jgi:hypothetical protein